MPSLTVVVGDTVQQLQIQRNIVTRIVTGEESDYAHTSINCSKNGVPTVSTNDNANEEGGDDDDDDDEDDNDSFITIDSDSEDSDTGADFSNPASESFCINPFFS